MAKSLLSSFTSIFLSHQPLNYQSVRYARRTCKPPRVWAPRKVNNEVYKHHLTSENRSFLDELSISQVKEKLKIANSPLKDINTSSANTEWGLYSARTGVLAIKIGVQPQWTKDGEYFTTTLLQILDNHVISYTPPSEMGKDLKWNKFKKHGKVIVGALSDSPLNFTKAYNNLFINAGLPPKKKLTKFLITPDAALEAGTPLTAMHFQVGDYVDCQAKTIGHGFQGVVKRWGFKGGPASHGTTKWHRRPGCISGGGDKSGIWKGKKMPGHMGMEYRIAKGLRIWRINTDYNILYVHGQAIPGPTHCYVRLYDTVLPKKRKEMLNKPPPMPTLLVNDSEIPSEIFHDDLFKFSDPSITFTDKT